MMRLWSLILVGAGHAGLGAAADIDAMDADRIQSFRAEYGQLGYTLTVEVERDDEEGLLHAGIGADVEGAGPDLIGHRLPQLTVAYRRVGALSIVAADESVTLLRVARGDAPVRIERRRGEPFIDGTLAYWLIAAWPLEEGFSGSLPVLVPHFPAGDDFTIREATFRVEGREPVSAADGRTYDCWIVQNQAGESGHFLSYVTPEPPYLVRQVMVQPDGTVQETLILKKRLPDESAE